MSDFKDFPSAELDNLLNDFILKHFPNTAIKGVVVLAQSGGMMTSQFSYETPPITDEEAIGLLEAAKVCIREPDEVISESGFGSDTKH